MTVISSLYDLFGGSMYIFVSVLFFTVVLQSSHSGIVVVLSLSGIVCCFAFCKGLLVFFCGFCV